MRELGAEIRLIGADLDEAKEEARAWAAERGLPFFEDGAEPAQYEGYGAIADEILDAARRAAGAIVVPVGNGALLGGIGLRPAERGARDAPGRRRRRGGAGDGGELAGRAPASRAIARRRSPTGWPCASPIPLAVDVLGEVASRMLLVSEREIARAVGAFADAGIRVEGAAAAASPRCHSSTTSTGRSSSSSPGATSTTTCFTRAREQPELLSRLSARSAAGR